MTLLEIMTFICFMAFINILSFIVGARVGQQVMTGKEVEMPKIEPIKTIREYNESKENKLEQERNKIIAQNIDSYNGTPEGQLDIPR